MSYTFLTKEEQIIWEECLAQIKNETLTLSDLKVIFHCNSYFKQIAGAEEEQYTTLSTLIALDKKDNYRYIESVENISYFDFIPNTYETSVQTFQNYEDILSFLKDDWEKTKQYILHYEENIPISFDGMNKMKP